jgi:hypothetical protein
LIGIIGRSVITEKIIIISGKNPGIEENNLNPKIDF